MRTIAQQIQILKNAKTFVGALRSTKYFLHELGQDPDDFNFDSIEAMIDTISALGESKTWDGRIIRHRFVTALKALNLTGNIELQSNRVRVSVKMTKVQEEQLTPKFSANRTPAWQLAWTLLDEMRDIEVISFYMKDNQAVVEARHNF